MEDDADLHTRVATLVSASLVPIAQATGKKVFAHSFIARGIRRSKTNLGDLSIPEYNTGFIRLINYKGTPVQDKPYMFRHLEHINEDAINYEWADTRAWSEEVCSLIAEGEMVWSDEYRLDLLRLKMSQQNRLKSGPGGSTSASQAQKEAKDASLGDIVYTLSPELRAAKPGPPCRAFNNGSCQHSGDHVTNGYRQIHVCAHCISAKCLFWPHGDKGCRSKDFLKKKGLDRNTSDKPAGFGR